MIRPNSIDGGWEEAGGKAGQKWRFTWSVLLWSLVYPQRGQRILPTTSGTILIALSLGIGSAAYNAANNILFIALSLMLSCLILSGVLSWLNFRGLTWRLVPPPSMRAGHETLVSVDVRNGKRVLPTYGLWFTMMAKRIAVEDGQEPVPPHAPGRKMEGRPPGRPKQPSVREIMGNAGRNRVRGRLYQRSRLDPGGETRLEWAFKPAKRGRHQLAIEAVGSLFPFGFLQKNLMADSHRDIVVWPAPIEYRRTPTGSIRAQPAGTRASGAGMGGDLVALRKYAPGDSHSVIHWKASARMRELLVRQFSAESHQTFSLWFQPAADIWQRPEQFELAVRFVASLAEDLFRGGQLRTVAIGAGEPSAIRRIRDLELFLDELAVVQVDLESAGAGLLPGGARGRNLITFIPDGARGVIARADSRPMATV